MTTPSYLGYASVSTGEQTLDAQRDALRAAGCTQIFSDVASGAKADRTGLEAVLAALQGSDTLVVARLDRHDVGGPAGSSCISSLRWPTSSVN